jgi:hypothetical protein
MVEALRTDNGWLEYKLMAAEDDLLDKCTLASEAAKEVAKVKVVLQDKEGALVMASGELQKARDALVEAQTMLTQRETALSEAQTQL